MYDLYFFFQAEDGIRDGHVTGVQTCALPILSQNLGITRKEAKQFIERYFAIYPGVASYMKEIVQEAKHQGFVTTIMKIGRASCRERVEDTEVAEAGERENEEE